MNIEKDYLILKGIAICYKSSPYLTESRKKELINKLLEPYKEVSK